MDFKKREIPESILKLAEEREEARKQKDWNKADTIRRKIEDEGYALEDRKEGHAIKMPQFL